jgi:DNA-binding YbaB/EbfC family protein
MNINPFDLFKNAQKIQEQMKEIQQRLAAIVVTGRAGGDMVQIDMNGAMEVLAVRIAPEVLEPVDIPLLQELIKAAFTDAMAKVKETISTETGSIASNLGIPPGVMGI